jgi:hypothetical protein
VKAVNDEGESEPLATDTAILAKNPFGKCRWSQYVDRKIIGMYCRRLVLTVYINGFWYVYICSLHHCQLFYYSLSLLQCEIYISKKDYLCNKS